jgi:uncharacterized protein YejL (UPF0352 family)
MFDGRAVLLATAGLASMALAAPPASAASTAQPDSSFFDSLVGMHMVVTRWDSSPWDPPVYARQLELELQCPECLGLFHMGIARPDSAHLVLTWAPKALGTWRTWSCGYRWVGVDLGFVSPGHHEFELEVHANIPADTVFAGGEIVFHRRIAYEVPGEGRIEMPPMVGGATLGESACADCAPVRCPGRPVPLTVSFAMTTCFQYEGLSLDPPPLSPTDPQRVRLKFRGLGGMFCVPEPDLYSDSIELPGLPPGHHELLVLEEHRTTVDSSVVVLSTVRRSLDVADYLTSECPFGSEADSTAGVRLLAGPNPTSGDVGFWIRSIQGADADLSVFDLSGRRVANLLHEHVPAGQRQVHWNGSGLKRGVYFARLTMDGKTRTNRILLMRDR